MVCFSRGTTLPDGWQMDKSGRDIFNKKRRVGVAWAGIGGVDKTGHLNHEPHEIHEKGPLLFLSFGGGDCPSIFIAKPALLLGEQNRRIAMTGNELFCPTVT